MTANLARGLLEKSLANAVAAARSRVIREAGRGDASSQCDLQSPGEPYSGMLALRRKPSAANRARANIASAEPPSGTSFTGLLLTVTTKEPVVTPPSPSRTSTVGVYVPGR